MQKLIDLTNGEKRVYVNLPNGKAKSDFLFQAEKEGFVIGKKLPTHCICEDIMIIHSDYTITSCTTWGAIAAYPFSKIIDYEKYSSGASDFYINLNK